MSIVLHHRFLERGFETWTVGFVLGGGETLRRSKRQLSQDICDCKVFKAIQEETAKDKAK